MEREYNEKVAEQLGLMKHTSFSPMDEHWHLLFIELSQRGRSPQLTFDHQDHKGNLIYWAMVGCEDNFDNALAEEAYGVTPGEALCNAYLLACGILKGMITQRSLYLIEDWKTDTENPPPSE